ncbi:hypothetical protein Tco_1226202, partial [Tanacetum coccineum]
VLVNLFTIFINGPSPPEVDDTDGMDDDVAFFFVLSLRIGRIFCTSSSSSSLSTTLKLNLPSINSDVLEYVGSDVLDILNEHLDISHVEISTSFHFNVL